MMHAKRSEINIDIFTTARKTYLNRLLFETERSFFGNTVEKNYTEPGADCEMSFSDREKALLLMDKRTSFGRSVFSSVRDWNDARDKLKKNM